MKTRRDADSTPNDFDGTFEGTVHRQVLEGLKLDYAARLRWLEERMEELTRLKGRVAVDSPRPPAPHVPIPVVGLETPSVAERVDELLDGFAE
jgi:hypothetical protein